MDIITRLRGIPFMSHLRHPQLMLLAPICQPQRFIAGEDIIHQGDLQNRFFIIDEGHVHFRKTDTEGFEQPVGSKGPGEYFCLKMFTTQEPSEYTVEAVGQAVLYILPREDFDELLKAHPKLLHYLPEIEAERRKMTLGFHWLTPGEIVQWSSHRHRITLLIALLPQIAALMAIGILLILISSFGLLRDSPFLPWVPGVLITGVLIWGIASGGDWFDDDFIVTNKRVAHSERELFLREEREEIAISKIQVMTVRVKGPLQKLFGVSGLDIRSAGRDEGHIEFDHIRDAEKVKQLIMKQLFLLRAHEQAIERERFRRRVSGELQHYVLKQPTPEPSELQHPHPTPHHTRRHRLKEFWQQLFGNEFRHDNTITWRKHKIILIQQTSKWGAGMILLIALSAAYLALPLLKIVPPLAFFGIVGVLFAVVLGGLIYQWEDWINDIYQVNEREIIDIERQPFGLNETSKVTMLMNVQDVSAKRPNLLHTIFNYGNVIIQVAGAGEPLTFHNVARPQEIVEEIFRRTEAFRIKRMERETSIQSRQIIDALVAFNRLLAQQKHGDGEAPVIMVAATQTPTLPENTQAVEQLSAPQPIEPAQPAPRPKVIDDKLSEFPPATEYDDT